jgi:thiol-disulfide isomerase/thioredoxin
MTTRALILIRDFSGQARAVKKLALIALTIIALLSFRLVVPAQLPVVDAQNFMLHEAGAVLPDFQFEDGQGRRDALGRFRGKLVLLNVWATWCPPCRKEIASLDRLETALGGADFEVLTLSVDRGGKEKVKKFYAEVGVQHLAIQVDPSGEAQFELGVVGLPTTLLVDPGGRELGRFVGAAQWNAPETIAFLKSIVSERRSRSAGFREGGAPVHDGLNRDPVDTRMNCRPC